MRKNTGSVIALLTILGLVAGLSSPAYAETHRATDSQGDVVAVNELDYTPIGPAPENADADITKSVVKHGRLRILVKVKLRDLTAVGGDGERQISVQLRAGWRQFSVVATKLPHGQTLLGTGGNGAFADCRGVRQKFSAAEDRITVSVPRICLKNPRWIKAQVEVSSTNGSIIYRDEALRAGLNPEKLPRSTPRLKRG